jgi:NADH-quinone oxidoreductase subunit I
MIPEASQQYFRQIGKALRTTFKGAQLTLRHLRHALLRPKVPPVYPDSPTYFAQSNEGIVTLGYPHEHLPVPQHARYQLHNEIDDCIVCDKCAKICPVNCIDIEAVKSPDVIGHTSDGTAKRLYAAKFDIDMAKCCFCGLCTTVCPTECLTMTDEYDFSTFEVAELNFPFATMTPEEVAQRQREYDEAQAAKKAASLQKNTSAETPASGSAKPAFRPRVVASSTQNTEKQKDEPVVPSEEEAPKKPVFRPKMKPQTTEAPEPETPAAEAPSEEEAPKKPVFRPKMKPQTTEAPEPETPAAEAPSEEEAPKKPVFRPKMKPKTPPPAE